MSTYQQGLKRAFLLSTFLLLLFAIPCGASVDPAISWKTWRLPHFDLIYDANNQELADIYAPRLEEAYRRLTPLFPSYKDRTVVVLTDASDLSNGFTGIFPYSLIGAYPVLPSSLSTISEYKDWASELVTHEFTHVLALTPQRGLFHYLSYVLGSMRIVSPNTFLPRWWNEGLAVEMETRFSNGGRLRSPVQDSWLRSYLLDNKWDQMDLSGANEVGFPWPYGARPYFLGALLWSEIISSRGEKNIYDLTWAHAGEVPYFLNSPSIGYLGLTYKEFFDQAKISWKERVQKQVNQLKVHPAVPPSVLPSLSKSEPDSLESWSPAISPDGLKFAATGTDLESGRSWLGVAVRKDTSVPFDFKSFGTRSSSDQGSFLELETTAIHHLSWSPDSTKIVFDSADIYDEFYFPSDLYIYDISQKKVQTLSKKLRGREPAFSPDGETLVFVKLLPGKTEIATFDLQNKKMGETLVSSPLQGRCSYPTYLNKDTLIYAYKDSQEDSLRSLDLKTKTSKKILEAYSGIRFLAVVHGRLLFTSLANGISNLYLADASLDQARPVSHSYRALEGGTWDWDRNEYYSSEQTANGLKLRRWSQSLSDQLPSRLPVVKPLFEDRYPSSAPHQEFLSLDEVNTQSSVESSPIEDYSSLGYLRPRYFIPPFISIFSLFDDIEVSSSGVDPLGKHYWAATGRYQADFSQRYKVLDYSVEYINRQTLTGIVINLFSRTDLHRGMADADGITNDKGQSLKLNWTLSSISPYLSVGPGWKRKSYDNFSSISPKHSVVSGPLLTLNYSNVLPVTRAQISPESGTELSLDYGFVQKTEFFDYNQYELSWIKYWAPSRLPPRHVLMTKLLGFYMDQPYIGGYARTSSAVLDIFRQGTPQYLMRGYKDGAFSGRSLVNFTFEYRMPFHRLYSGWETYPIFLEQLHGAFVLDGVNVDGTAYNDRLNERESTNLSTNFSSLGAEARLSFNLGYYLGLTFYAGIYYPTTQALTDDPHVRMGLYF